MLENPHPGKEVGQAFQPDLQCLYFVPGSWRHQRGRLLQLLGWRDNGAIHVSQVPECGWPRPLRSLPAQALPAMRLVLLQSAIQNPKIENPKSCVGPAAILTGSRTRPSDWGWNRRFGPVEDRRNNRRLATATCTLCVVQIWWLSPFPFAGRRFEVWLRDLQAITVGPRHDSTAAMRRPQEPHLTPDPVGSMSITPTLQLGHDWPDISQGEPGINSTP